MKEKMVTFNEYVLDDFVQKFQKDFDEVKRAPEKFNERFKDLVDDFNKSLGIYENKHQVAQSASATAGLGAGGGKS